jgi:protein SCO1/2
MFKDSRSLRSLLPLVLLLAVALATPAVAQSDEAASKHYFTDVELVNQFGEPMRLHEDLMKGKTVVINAFFTECTGVCPVMAKKLAQLQDVFADSMGSELNLISMSVDPITDSPDELMKFARRYGAGPGWYFVGGSKENVDFALSKLGQYVDEREAHSNLLLIGNLRTGLWKKVLGLADTAELAGFVREVMDDKGGAPAGGQ